MKSVMPLTWQKYHDKRTSEDKMLYHEIHEKHEKGQKILTRIKNEYKAKKGTNKAVKSILALFVFIRASICAFIRVKNLFFVCFVCFVVKSSFHAFISRVHTFGVAKMLVTVDDIGE